MGKLRVMAMAMVTLLAPGVSPAEAQDSWGRLYPSLFYTSDYRYEGMSLTGHEHTPQASLYWWRPDKFFAGVWMSRIDFSDLGDSTTSFEIDIYGGRHFDFGRTQLTFEGMYSLFPDKDVPGPTYNFITAKARVRRSIDALTVGSGIGWTPEAPYGGGVAWRLNGEASYAWSKWLKTDTHIGRRWNRRSADRTFWDLGVTTTWKKMSVDLRYSDTNLTFVECGFVNWCEAGVTATLQLDLWK